MVAPTESRSARLMLIAGAAVEWSERVALFRAPMGTAWARMRNLPRASWGMTIAHAGLGLMVMGIAGVTAQFFGEGGGGNSAISRTRGLGRTSTTRNFFKTDIPNDVYNTGDGGPTAAAGAQ